jgi:hypothetical protein
VKIEKTAGDSAPIETRMLQQREAVEGACIHPLSAALDFWIGIAEDDHVLL